MADKKDRQSNIELLRCVLMFMIVVLHFIGHNNLDSNAPVQLGGVNFISANLLFSFCVCAVDCFVLISGYFTIHFTIKRLVLILLPICFYQFILSILFYNVHHVISISPFNYWFVGPYLMLFLVSPFLNEGLKNISKNNLLLFIILCSIIFIIPIHSILGEAGKNFSTFVYLYVLGYYLRNYTIHSIKSRWYFFLYVLMSLLIFIETFVLSYYGKNEGSATLSYNYDNILIIASAVFLFQTFRYINIKSIFINWVAASSFYVYIISENENMYGHPGLYDLVKVNEWSSPYQFVILVFLSSLAVFIFSIIIDKIRLFLFGNLETKLCNWIDNRFVQYK